MRRVALLLLGLLLCPVVLPRVLCGVGARAWADHDLEVADAYASSLIRAIQASPGPLFYQTGSRRFNGQSAIAIYQMTPLGLGQIVAEHPEKREVYLPVMRLAAARMVRRETLSFAADVYGHDGTVRMGTGEGHAYLGYVNMGLSMLRSVDPENPQAALNDRLSEALEKRLFGSKTSLFETYPGESWPPDVAAVAGSIGLYAAATGQDRRAELDTWGARFADCAIHASGFLIQRVKSGTCEPVDGPRGSGTAIAAYFLSFSNPDLARRLAAAVAKPGLESVLGFGAVREYAPGFDGSGDGDSGPVILGVSVGATGFGLGAAQIAGDRDLFVKLYRTTALFGAPVDAGEGGRTFALGGVLGNALLLAMLTARAP